MNNEKEKSQLKNNLIKNVGGLFAYLFFEDQKERRERRKRRKRKQKRKKVKKLKKIYILYRIPGSYVEHAENFLYL